MTKQAEIEKAIAVLESQRALLGDAIVDTAILPLRQRLVDRGLTESSVGTKLTHERKLITILFVDVVGSTALGSQLDANTSRLIMNRCLQRLSEAVDEFGGMVAQLLGDGLLAFFGAPQANEDDPERAALAAISMHRRVAELATELAQPLQIRVGINTGRVVIGEVGGQVHSEYLATGQAVNLAARLESTAEPGHTLLGESTARMVNHRFHVEAVDPLSLKGFSEPIKAFSLIRDLAEERAAFEITGRITTLVGREVELARINSRLAKVEQGSGGIAALIGEPGIGKSRLFQEIRKKHQNGRFQFAEGRAYSYTQDQPFRVVIDLLMELLDLASDDTPTVLDLKLEAALTPLFESELGKVWPYLSALLGAPLSPAYASSLIGLDPEALNAKFIQAVQMLVEKMALRRPMVLSFEDLHWADSASLKLIETLMLSTEHSPIFLVFLFRPDLDKPVWQLKLAADTHFAHRYSEIKLTPLGTSASAQMIKYLLEDADIPITLQDVIREKAQGNPLFIEELIHSLIESGFLVQNGDIWNFHDQMAEAIVPENLEAVIQARLDRLPPTERAILQTASVIGRRFAYPVLAGMVAANGHLKNHLLRLQQKGMISQHSLLPEPEYAFKHIILQQVTYGTLLGEQRRILHLQAAEMLEQINKERLNELAPTLAEHYSAAGESHRAIEYFLIAAKQAEKLFAFEEALHFLQRAEMHSQRQSAEPMERLRILESLADVHLLLRNAIDAYVLFEKALALQRNMVDADKWMTVRLHRKICEAWWILPREDEERLEARSMEYLDAALALIDGEPPNLESVHLLVMASNITRAARREQWRMYIPSGKSEDEYAKDAVRMAEQLDTPVELSAALNVLSQYYALTGRFRDNLSIAQRRRQLIHHHSFNNLREELSILIGTAAALKTVGDYAQAIPLLLESEELAEQIRDVAKQAEALWLQAECWTRLDQWDHVLLTEQKIGILQRSHPLKRLGPICSLLAFSAYVHTLRGNHEHGARLAEESYAIMTGSMFMGAREKEQYWGSAQYY